MDLAFEKIYKLHKEQIYRLIYRIVGNEAIAEELLQETFLRFLENMPRVRQETYLPFLFRIAHNLAVNHLKKFSREVSMPEGTSQPWVSDMTHEVEHKIAREEIYRQLANAHEDYLKIFIMRVDFRMTYQEIADIIGSSLRQVMRDLERIQRIVAAGLR